MKIVRLTAIAITLLCGNAANAGTRVLGFELGESTVEQVKSSLQQQTKVTDAGINKFSDGPMIKTNGDSYEIEGLREVIYIFDEASKLAGILMEMNKGRFDSVYQAISSKYKVISQQRPFVGDQSARFKTEDAIIEIDAPHLSFEMEVRYLRNDLVQKYNAISTEEASAKKKREAEKF